MRKTWSVLFAFSLICVTALPALADVSDYLGTNSKASGCPKTIVIRPEFSEKNIIYPVSPSTMDEASNMIGSALASKYDGSVVISGKDLNQYKACDSPVVLAKLKSYTTESAIFGQHEGRMAVTVFHFKSPSSDSPDKQTDVSATGERHWGDDVPFTNAAQALSEKIQRTSF